jgi:hypothetical protein
MRKGTPLTVGLLAALAMAGVTDYETLPRWTPAEPELNPVYEAAVNVRRIALADLRKAKRTRKRLEALVSGGWQIEFQPCQHLGLQTSTRGERRRAQLGRA